MHDVLLYYCGGDRGAVRELLVSLYSLVRADPGRRYEVRIMLDEESRRVAPVEELERLPGVRVSVFSGASGSFLGRAVHHVVNRWRATRQFAFDRLLILDTDTVINRPLGSLFDELHPDPAYFTTFSGLSEFDIDWENHCRFYDAVGSDYVRHPLYCRIGLHGFYRGWPHVDEVTSTVTAMDAVQGRRKSVRSLVIDEYAVTRVLLCHGRRVHFPRLAIVKGSLAASMPRDQWPDVWHFILGRGETNPLWQETWREACERNFARLADEAD